MRKIILGVVIVAVSFFAIFLFLGINSRLIKKSQISEKIAKMPAFSYMTLSNEIFISRSIEKGPVLIVHYDPECEHCQYEISALLKSDVPGSGVKIILISGANPDSLRNFLSRFNYTDFPEVITLIDPAYTFEDIFGGKTIPSSYVYNEKLELIQVLHGEVKIETIIKYLRMSE